MSPETSSRPLEFKIAPVSLTNTAKNVQRQPEWHRLNHRLAAERYEKRSPPEAFRYAGGGQVEPSY
jgi:hypothetical protein